MAIKAIGLRLYTKVNKGDGSAVEIVGLSKSALRWLSTLSESNEYPYSGVKLKSKGGKETILSFKEWNDKIQQSFEDKFWISVEPNPAREGDETKIIHRRGIYKDVHGATHRFTDYQLRPNFPIAMTVAPELFDPKHAWHALKMVEETLLGPLGLATLDPRDWMYDGNYDNSRDSTIFKKARGFNYHQGPEWLWIMGPFLRAKLHFSKIIGGKEGLEEAVISVRTILARHKEELAESPWRGLPELTNAGGAFCQDGCPTQAWSMGCILEVLYDMENLLGETCGKSK